jgi:hypothetical protein
MARFECEGVHAVVKMDQEIVYFHGEPFSFVNPLAGGM